MAPELLLEITVESLDSALAAERGGADRIELCAELNRGGLTPSAAAMRKLHEELEIPVFPIIRPRAGDFVYSEIEFAAMKRDISLARDLGMDGIVFGILRPDHSVDVERTAELVQWARPLEVTIHRAFDLATDLLLALEDVIATGATRILTAGGAAIAPDGKDDLRKLVDAAGDRIVIMPGGGLDATNITKVVADTRAREFHSGLGSVLPYGSSNLLQFEAEIHTMKRRLKENSGSK
ncbi:MAG: copper homeostasis protein CutC [Candidatus Acidiferrum sp.]